VAGLQITPQLVQVPGDQFRDHADPQALGARSRPPMTQVGRLGPAHLPSSPCNPRWPTGDPNGDLSHPPVPDHPRPLRRVGHHVRAHARRARRPMGQRSTSLPQSRPA
jgi:hypothetical protein